MAEKQARRASPRYGGRLGHAIFRAIVRCCGVRPAYALLPLVAAWYVLCRPSARRSDAAYLRHRFPELGPLGRLWMTMRHIIELGKVLIDQGALGLVGRERYRVSFPNESSLHALARDGRGLILLCAHMGPWQAAMASMEALGVPLSFQFQVEDHTRGRAFWEITGEEEKFHIIPPSSPMGGLVEMTAALNRGEAVAVMGDRALGAPTVEARFLGEKAPFPRVAYHLARPTGAPLAALFVRRTGPLALELDWKRLGEGEETASETADRARQGAWIRACAAEYAAALEQRVAAYPLQWFNFFDFWCPDSDDR